MGFQPLLSLREVAQVCSCVQAGVLSFMYVIWGNSPTRDSSGVQGGRSPSKPRHPFHNFHSEFTGGSLHRGDQRE